MAFKVALTPKYNTKVTVVTPNEKGGNDKSEFTVTFIRFDTDQLDGLRELSQKEVLQKAVAGWSGLQADDGSEIEFSDVNLSLIFKVPQAFKAVTEAFWLTQYGAKEKN